MRKQLNVKRNNVRPSALLMSVFLFLCVLHTVRNANAQADMGSTLSFDGKDDRVALKGTKSKYQHFIKGQGSILLWVKPSKVLVGDNKNDRQFALSSSGSIQPNHRDINIGMNTKGNWWLVLSDTENYLVQTPSAKPKPEAGTWYHLAVVFGGSDRGLYINGKKQASWDQFSGNTGKWQHPLHLGYAPDSNRNWFGAVNDVRFYERNLSPSEVRKTMYNSGKDVVEEDLAGYWPMTEGNGSTVHDRSGNGNHGKIDGAKWTGDILPSTFLNPSIQKRGSFLVNVATKHKRPSLRSHAVRALGQGDVDAETITPVLVDILKQEKTDDVRHILLDVIADGNVVEQDLLPALLKIFVNTDESDDLRLEVLDLFRQFDVRSGRVASGFVHVLKNRDESDKLRFATLDALSQLDVPQDEIAGGLVDIVQNTGETKTFRLDTLDVLTELDRAAEVIAPGLVKVLTASADALPVREAVPGALARLDPSGTHAAPLLFDVLKTNNADEITHRLAYAALGKMKGIGKDLAEVLVEILNESERAGTVSKGVFLTLLFYADSAGSSGLPVEKLAPSLLAVLEGGGNVDRARTRALEILGPIDETIDPVTLGPVLLDALETSEDNVEMRRAVMGPLLTHLEHATDHHIVTFDTLKKADVTTQDVVAGAIYLLRSDDNTVRRTGFGILSSIGSASIPLLRRELQQNQRGFVRSGIVTIIGVIEPAVEDVQSELMRVARADSDPYVRRRAVEVLRDLDPEHEHVDAEELNRLREEIKKKLQAAR